MIPQPIGDAPALVLALAGCALFAWPASAVVRPTWVRRGSPPSNARRAVMLGTAIAAAVVVLAPGLWWLALAGGLAVALLVRRGPWRPGPVPADLERLAAFCDLVAACLDAGMAVAPSLTAAMAAERGSRAAPPAPARSAPGDPSAPLESIAAMLELGADPDVAWRSADEHPVLAPLAAAARRSARGGTPLADAVRQHAVELRGQIDALAARAAGRAGVAMTAPLALCFLPGFICLGLAPVVIGLLGRLDIL